MYLEFSSTDFPHKGVAITPGLIETTLMSFLFSTSSALKNISRHRLEAQYGDINGKTP